MFPSWLALVALLGRPPSTALPSAPQFTGSQDADDADTPEKDRFSYVELVRRIQSNAKRYLDVISAAADFCVDELTREAAERGEDPAGGAAGQGVAVAADGSAMVTGSDDVFDVLQR